MNSEEKLMANKLENATKTITTKYQTNKYNKLSTENNRKTISKNNYKTNASHMLKLSTNGSECNESNRSNNYKHFFKANNLEKISNRRVGSPATDIEKRKENYYDNPTNDDKMPKKNLRLNSGNYRMAPLNQYPFPLTPLDKASNKPIEFEENIAAAKSQSTRNNEK